MAAMASVAQNAFTVQLNAMHYSAQPRYYTRPHSAWSHYSSTHSSSDPQPYNLESNECPFGNVTDRGYPFRHPTDIDEYIIPRTRQTYSPTAVPKPKVILTVPPKPPKPTSKSCWCFGM